PSLENYNLKPVRNTIRTPQRSESSWRRPRHLGRHRLQDTLCRLSITFAHLCKHSLRIFITPNCQRRLIRNLASHPNISFTYESKLLRASRVDRHGACGRDGIQAQGGKWVYQCTKACKHWVLSRSWVYR